MQSQTHTHTHLTADGTNAQTLTLLSPGDLIFLWLGTALFLPDKIHNFYLMLRPGRAFWRTLADVAVSHFRSTEDANYPLETLVERPLKCTCSLSFDMRLLSLSLSLSRVLSLSSHLSVSIIHFCLLIRPFFSVFMMPYVVYLICYFSFSLLTDTHTCKHVYTNNPLLFRGWHERQI